MVIGLAMARPRTVSIVGLAFACPPPWANSRRLWTIHVGLFLHISPKKDGVIHLVMQCNVTHCELAMVTGEPMVVQVILLHMRASLIPSSIIQDKVLNGKLTR
ncbi:hypothetical protein B0O99DRAFT_642178 [Bisporella sp. PMI_857]|nr:hypothetical protein B0O99DRAFT_642178 [Bisporella sp. PMI_857]